MLKGLLLALLGRFLVYGTQTSTLMPFTAKIHRTTMIRVPFSYTGMDIVVATAAESKALGDAESMKIAARKISLRIVVLYVLAVLTASFLVPSNHSFLNCQGQSIGSHSVFIIAAVKVAFRAPLTSSTPYSSSARLLMRSIACMVRLRPFSNIRFDLTLTLIPSFETL